MKLSPMIPYCRACHRSMTLVRTIPALGAMPQLDTYRCAGCGDVQTVEKLVQPPLMQIDELRPSGHRI
jgi:hypothetical protein